MWANPPEAEFQVTISKLRKRNKISSLVVYAVHKKRKKAFPRRSRVKTVKKCTKKVCCTWEVVVLLIKPIVFFTFSLPSASLDLKVPNISKSPSVPFWGGALRDEKKMCDTLQVPCRFRENFAAKKNLERTRSRKIIMMIIKKKFPVKY